MVPLNRPTITRIVAVLILVALVALDIFFHAELAALVGAYHLAAIILCAVVAFGLVLVLSSLISGNVSLEDANLKWLALLFFVILLLRYSLVSFFDLTPTVLVFIAIFICIIGFFRLQGGGRPGDERKRDIAITVRVLLIGLFFGLYLVVAAGGYAPKENAATVERTAMGWALAYFAILFLIGFLFGIPRVLQGDGGADAAKKMGYEQRVNTNLEQISDWLTKIIVGLGLVQLRTVPEKLQSAAKWMAQSFAPAGTPTDALISFAGAFIIFFSVLGFLAGYLSTRLFLSAAFYRADLRPEIVIADKTDAPSTDPIVERIRTFSRQNRQKLESWLAAKGKSGMQVAEFISDPQYTNLRNEAVDDKTLNIP